MHSRDSVCSPDTLASPRNRVNLTKELEFYTLFLQYIRENYVEGTWGKVRMRDSDRDLDHYKNYAGFESKTQAWAIPTPSRKLGEEMEEDDFHSEDE